LANEANDDRTGFWRFPPDLKAVLRRLVAESGVERWNLPAAVFEESLVRSAEKRFAAARQNPTPAQIEDYLGALHLADLALACACAQGCEPAWNEFVNQYRGYLRSAAAAIARKSAGDAETIELADSLFADLFGLPAGQAGRRSLFHYFHGRSSLKTWLRAILAQRHIDRIRAGKKFESLDEQDKDGDRPRLPEPALVLLPADPHRQMYLQRFREVLELALAALESRDRARLQHYYVEDRTLAEIGRRLGEHESSVSRNLERIRKELRATVEGLLRAGTGAGNGGASEAGFDEAQIELCIQYAGEDAGIDLDKLFAVREAQKISGPERKAKP
jgi:RNA polymerase sigma-70 factor, ECF subfamily